MPSIGDPVSFPPEPKPSAIVILRHPDGEIYLVKRPKGSRFFPGFYAFPGGALEAQDGDPGYLSALVACAQRELAEETLVDVPATRLEPAGRVVTPEFSPIRYDTQFFLAQLDEHVEPEPQAPELAGGAWFQPHEALEAWKDGVIRLPPPVIHSLEVLADQGPEGLVAKGTEVQDFPIAFATGLRVEPLEVGTLPPHTHTNAFVLGEDELAVVDPGATGSALDPLLDGLDELSRPDGGVAWVLLTHHHEDHVAGLEEIVQHFGSKLACSAETAERLGRKADLVLTDGDTLEVGGVTIEAVETPGHAPGHLAFHVPRSQAILPGDLVAGIGTVLIPPGEGDMADYMASLERLADLAEAKGTRLLFPAHGPPSFQPVETLRGTLEHRRDREAKVLDAVPREGATVETIAEAAYQDKPEAPQQLKEMSTQAHLHKLAQEDQVEPRDQRWFRL